MRVIFMGTPDFAVGTLEAIVEAGHEVVLAVTQPDKPKGRGREVQLTPVKECALKHGIEVFQPVKVRETANIKYLRKFNPDIIVVAAFGQLLPKSILDMPKYCCINVHASLLPKYRGAAPIQWAVINGDEFTGVTIMRMDEGLDTGDMIAKATVRVESDETGGRLFDKLSGIGAKLCVETMKMIEEGRAEFTPQNSEEATHTSMISKELGYIDWTKPAESIERLIRGLNPWPSAYTKFEGKTLKIWSADVEEDAAGRPSPETFGQVVRVGKDAFSVQTGKGLLTIRELQLEGKKRMDTAAFLRGYPVETGVKLG